MTWLNFMRERQSPTHFWRSISLACATSFFTPGAIVYFIGAILLVNVAPWVAETTESNREENLVLLTCLLGTIFLLALGTDTLLHGVVSKLS